MRDTCLLCSSPVYDDDPGLDFLGLWMHRDCFDQELGVPLKPEQPRPAA